MIEIATSFMRVVRVWLGDAPALLCGSEKNPLTLVPHAKAQVDCRTVTVEVVIPRGASIQWGLLGATFETRSGGDLVVEVCDSGQVNSERRYPGSLISALEEPRIELPTDLAAAAIDGVLRESSALGSIPHGRYTIDRAAYGDISSSEELFGLLGELIAMLIALEIESEDHASKAAAQRVGAWRS